MLIASKLQIKPGQKVVVLRKGRQLGTDLNRDTLADALNQRGVQPVRSISVDSTWSALRFRPA